MMAPNGVAARRAQRSGERGSNGILICGSGLLLRHAASVALDCFRIDVPLSLLVIPLLICRFPYLGLAALPADEWLVEIKLRQAAVGIDVRKLAVVGRHGRRMMPLRSRIEAQDSLGLPDVFCRGIAAGVLWLSHAATRT